MDVGRTCFRALSYFLLAISTPQPEFKKSILDWLQHASTVGAAQFGDNRWAKMHSGGTSQVPNCRPYGMKKKTKVGGPKKGNKVTKVDKIEYNVKLECAPNPKKPDSRVTVVESYVVDTDKEPTTPELYAELKKKVEAL